MRRFFSTLTLKWILTLCVWCSVSPSVYAGGEGHQPAAAVQEVPQQYSGDLTPALARKLERLEEKAAKKISRQGKSNPKGHKARRYLDQRTTGVLTLCIGLFLAGMGALFNVLAANSTNSIILMLGGISTLGIVIGALLIIAGLMMIIAA